MTQLVKIRTSKIPYNSQIVIPRVYIDDNSINAGDVVEIYRGVVNGKDAIVIFPAAYDKDNKNKYKNLVNDSNLQDG